MRIKRRSLPASLAKQINPANAPAKGLRRQFCLAPDESDKKAYVVEEMSRRIKMFEQEHGLDRNTPNLNERRTKAAVELIFGISPDAPDWWAKVGLTLLIRFVPGFSISSRGRPRKWQFTDYIDLYADVRAIKAKRPELRGKDLCKALQRKERWAKFRISALRRAQVHANAIARSYPEPASAPAT